MRCEEVLGALAAGESGEALDSHVAGCARCAAVVRRGGFAVGAAPASGLLTGAPPPVVRPSQNGAPPPMVPTISAFRARERRERAVRGGLLAAAAVVLVIGASRLGTGGLTESGAGPAAGGAAGGVAVHDSRPPIPAGEGPWDVRTGMDDLVDPDPLGDLADPTDLFDVALSGEGSL